MYFKIHAINAETNALSSVLKTDKKLKNNVLLSVVTSSVTQGFYSTLPKLCLKVLLYLILLSSASAEVLKTCDPLISSQSSHLRLISLLLQHILCAQLGDEIIETEAYMHELTHTDTHRQIAHSVTLPFV